MPLSYRQLSGLVSVAELTLVFPPGLIDEVIASAGHTEQRNRSLPARTRDRPCPADPAGRRAITNKMPKCTPYAPPATGLNLSITPSVLTELYWSYDYLVMVLVPEALSR